jgi:chitin synthase
LTDYINTININSASTEFQFLDADIVAVFKERAGQDITKALNEVLATKDANTVGQNMNCIENLFYVGKVDFRKSPRCQVQNYFLIAASAILMSSMAIKCKESVLS